MFNESLSNFHHNMCTKHLSHHNPKWFVICFTCPNNSLGWTIVETQQAADFETSLVGPGNPWTNETSWNTFWNYLFGAGLSPSYYSASMWWHKPKPTHYNKFAQMFESALKYHCNTILINLGGQAVHMSLQIWITLPKKINNKCTGWKTGLLLGWGNVAGGWTVTFRKCMGIILLIRNDPLPDSVGKMFPRNWRDMKSNGFL